MRIRYRGAPIDRQRRWIVVAVATAAYQFSYVPILWLVAAERGTGEVPEGAITVALSVVPLVLSLVAFGSRHARAPIAVLQGMGLALVVGLMVGLVDVLPGLVGGYTAAAAVTLRTDAGAAARKPRIVAVVAVTVGVLVSLVVLPPFALLAGAAAPFVAVATADEWVDRRTAEA